MPPWRCPVLRRHGVAHECVLVWPPSAGTNKQKDRLIANYETFVCGGLESPHEHFLFFSSFKTVQSARPHA